MRYAERLERMVAAVVAANASPMPSRKTDFDLWAVEKVDQAATLLEACERAAHLWNNTERGGRVRACGVPWCDQACGTVTEGE